MTDASRRSIPTFTDGPLVRVQFIVARYDGRTPEVATAQLEQQIVEIIRTWEDRLVERHIRVWGRREAVEQLKGKYRAAFSAGYAETFPPERALEDIKRIERLGPDRTVAIDFYSESGDRRARRGLPLRSAHAVVGARADAGEPRLLGDRRAYLSHHAALQRGYARGHAA